MTQLEFCPIQLQLNQIYNDCEGALAWAESELEELEIIAIADRQIKELLNQESQVQIVVSGSNEGKPAAPDFFKTPII